jgi:putative ABC transport system ATP-binding protein
MKNNRLHESTRQAIAWQSADEGLSASVPVIDLHQVVKTYESPSGPFTALRGISLQVQAGEFVAVVGKSGSGKSTLLNLLAGIDRLTSGSISVAGTQLDSLSESQLAEWRGRTIGLVFQFFQLLPTLTIAENVMLPMDFAKIVPAAERQPRALELLERVGIRDQAGKLPVTLSGGQQQRAAIARALANDPPILMADEPTGNLDEATRTSVLELFARLNADGRTIIVVTHERDISVYTNRQVTLVDGRVADDAGSGRKLPWRDCCYQTTRDLRGTRADRVDDPRPERYRGGVQYGAVYLGHQRPRDAA